MKFQYCSDLHLEFDENRRFLNENPIVASGDVLLLAGDIVPFAVMDKYADFFDYISDHFEMAWWVPGNHEYYHADISGRSGQLNEKIRDNVSLVNNVSVLHNGIELIFSTLWTRISPVNDFHIRRGMADFHRIMNHEVLFTPDDCNSLHESSRSFITEALKNSTILQKVVVTHHVPTFMNYPEEYRGSILNEAFAVELSELIESDGPDYWIYGHHHSDVEPFYIGKTQMLTNQLGYVAYGEHGRFDHERCIDYKMLNVNK